MVLDRAIQASAPGKLFLMGEYAVLEGAPALLTAVDRRARVTLTPAEDGHWTIDAPNLGVHKQSLGVDGSLPVDADETLARHLAVYDAVRAIVVENLDAPLPTLAVHIDTAEFAQDGYKLGLGSSAAVAAALTQALLAAVDIHPDLETLAGLAIAAHRRAQNGTGSGGDVAVSVFGGVISYTRDTAPRPLVWPTGLTGMAVVTGEGASTPDLVGRVYQYREHDPEGFASDMSRLAELAGRVGNDLGYASRFLRLTREYFEALIALDHHAGAGIVSARHHELSGLAASHGAVFKSSGAGGGDVGLLFSTRARDTAVLRETFAHAGAEILDLVFGADGVRLDDARARLDPPAPGSGLE